MSRRKVTNDGPGKPVNLVTSWKKMTQDERDRFERQWPTLAAVIKAAVTPVHTTKEQHARRVA